MAQAQNGDIVKVHYIGTLDDGTIFGSSEGRDPLEFQLGERRVLPAIEEAVVGMNVGESKKTKIPADEAHGHHRPELVLVVKREEFPENINSEVGQQLLMRQPTGQELQVTVTNADQESVTLDGNHPLAGKDLTFELQLVEIG